MTFQDVFFKSANVARELGELLTRLIEGLEIFLTKINVCHDSARNLARSKVVCEAVLKALEGVDFVAQRMTLFNPPSLVNAAA